MVLDFIIRSLGGDVETKMLVCDVLSMDLDVESPILEGFYQCHALEDILRDSLGVEPNDTGSDVRCAAVALADVHSPDSPCTGFHPTKVPCGFNITELVHSPVPSIPACPASPSIPGSVPPATVHSSVPATQAMSPSHRGSVPLYPHHVQSCPNAVATSHTSPSTIGSDHLGNTELDDEMASSDPSGTPTEASTSSPCAPTAIDTHASMPGDFDLDHLPVPNPPAMPRPEPATPLSDMETPLMHPCDYEPWFPNQQHLHVPEDMHDTHSQFINVAEHALPTVFRTDQQAIIIDLIKADMLCTGNPAPEWVSNRRGESLALDTRLQPSMTVVFWSKGECGLLPRMPWNFTTNQQFDHIRF